MRSGEVTQSPDLKTVIPYVKRKVLKVRVEDTNVVGVSNAISAKLYDVHLCTGAKGLVVFIHTHAQNTYTISYI